MNKAKFYAELRKRDSGVFGTSIGQTQVDVMEAIIAEADARGLTNPELAYILATAYHEPGPKSRMKPSREDLYYTTASRIRAVWPSRFPTNASASPYLRNPRKLANKVYNGRLGNRAGTDDGFVYRGGGLDHLTGRDNYRRASAIVGVDLVAEPHRILEPKIAVESLVHGMVTGRYRGHKLSDFLKPGAVDFVGAREVVNADRRLFGATIAAYARAFLSALEVAGRPYSPTPSGQTPAINTSPKVGDVAFTVPGQKQPGLGARGLAGIIFAAIALAAAKIMEFF